MRTKAQGSFALRANREPVVVKDALYSRANDFTASSEMSVAATWLANGVVGKQALGGEHVAKHFFLGSPRVAEKRLGLQGRAVVLRGQPKHDVGDLVEDGEALALFSMIAVDDDDVLVPEPGRLTGLVVSQVVGNRDLRIRCGGQMLDVDGNG